jgi:hypothetical protein
VTLLHILIFCAAAILLGLLRQDRWRRWLILALSVVAIYWMQPLMPIRQLDFWLPTATILLTLGTWIVLQTGQAGAGAAIRSALPGMALIAGLVLGVAALRYLGDVCCLTPSTPPPILPVIAALALAAVIAGMLFVLPVRSVYKMTLLILALTALMVELKTPPLTEAASAWLRALTRQPTEQATALDIRWLGISYVFFRLVHALWTVRRDCCLRCRCLNSPNMSCSFPPTRRDPSTAPSASERRQPRVHLDVACPVRGRAAHHRRAVQEIRAGGYASYPRWMPRM